MNRHPDQTRRRLAQMAGRLHSLSYPETIAPDEILVSDRVGRIGWAAARELAYRPAIAGETFGPVWATYWFRIAATIPETWAGSRVDLHWDCGSEATLWRAGVPLQGLNAGWRARRTNAVVLHPASGGERVELEVELACNSWMGDERAPGVLGDPFGEPRWRLGSTWKQATDDRAVRSEYVQARLERCGLGRFDADAWKLAWDFDTLRQVEAEHARSLDPAWAGVLLAELNRFCNIWQPQDRSTWPAAASVLAELMQQRNASRSHHVHALGHAHLDTAWLWPVAESRRKLIRIAANQLALLDRYPEHRFAASSAQHYVWLEEDAPALAERVAAKVAEGRWHVVGGAWVEPDCNLPSGESIVRQLLYGQRFFERRFGRRCREFWSPDTFGHGGQLPQILRLAGIDRFLTQKLSWNQFTSPLYHSFRWEGIDGSTVLAHMPPADTYNAEMTVAELRASAANAKDHDRTSRSLQLFGYGDGGGGPTEEMLELARRVPDLQGVPTLEISSADTFFERLDSDLHDGPRILGELYLEAHRGTYTSQAAVKRANRLGEGLLAEAEAAAAIADRLGRSPYPGQALEDLWRLLLVNQFHDILPGSSIPAVYEDAARDHAAVAEGATRLREAALASLAGAGTTPAPVNLTPCPRLEIVTDPTGAEVLVEVPSFGFGAAVPEPSDRVVVERSDDTIVLTNAALRATLDVHGALLSLVVLPAGREAIAAPGNRFELYEDLPTAYDAWEVEPYHAETRRYCEGADHCEVVAEGPLRAEIAFSHEIGSASRIRQVVRLDAHARRLEFRTTVEWAERHTLLKVVFPVLVRASHATYETQFGVHERPTHASTVADLARFEVPGHRFVDLTEHDFGVALLTDSTYGYSTTGNELRLSLLRASTDPDPNADQGSHEFAYAIFPHSASWQAAGVVAEARRFVTPVRWAGRGTVRGPFAEVGGGLILDTIKREEGGGRLVFRLYEPHGGRGVARLRLGVPFGAACLASLLEDEGAALAVEGGAIVVPFTPFQIITVLVA